MGIQRRDKQEQARKDPGERQGAQEGPEQAVIFLVHFLSFSL